MQTSGDDSQPLIALRTVFWLVAAAATLNLLSYARSVSHLHVYRDLQLGMPRSEAMQVLRAQSIDCGSLSSASYPKGSPPRECWFSDFWREYRLVFSLGGDGCVLMKSFAYRRHSPSLVRLIKLMLD